MKNITIMLCVVAFLLCGCSTYEVYPTHAKQREIVVYEDERMKICYNGIVENKLPWMTERGMEKLLIQSVSLEITNYTKNSYFITGSTLVVDGLDASPIEASLRIWAEGTHTYDYPSEHLNNLNPSTIQMSLYIFDIHNPELFEPYNVELDFNTATQSLDS